MEKNAKHFSKLYFILILAFNLNWYSLALLCCVVNIRCGARAPANCTSSALRFIFHNSHQYWNRICSKRMKKRKNKFHEYILLFHCLTLLRFNYYYLNIYFEQKFKLINCDKHFYFDNDIINICMLGLSVICASSIYKLIL